MWFANALCLLQWNCVVEGLHLVICPFPDAILYLRLVKVYLTATTKERARRRYKEQIERGIECNLAEIEENIKERDERDMNREFAPLRQAEDAVYLDCSDMTPEEVIEAILLLCKKARQ